MPADAPRPAVALLGLLDQQYYKALKTGLGVERLQLRTAHRLFAAVAWLRVVALALVNLRERMRQ